MMSWSNALRPGWRSLLAFRGYSHLSALTGIMTYVKLRPTSASSQEGSIGPRECEVRVSIGVKDFTTTARDTAQMKHSKSETDVDSRPSFQLC